MGDMDSEEYTIVLVRAGVETRKRAFLKALQAFWPQVVIVGPTNASMAALEDLEEIHRQFDQFYANGIVHITVLKIGNDFQGAGPARPRLQSQKHDQGGGHR